MIPRKVKEIERDLSKLHQCYAQYIGFPRESNGQIKVRLEWVCSGLHVYNNVLRATYKGVSQVRDKSGMTAYLITAEVGLQPFWTEMSMVNMKRSEVAS